MFDLIPPVQIPLGNSTESPTAFPGATPGPELEPWKHLKLVALARAELGLVSRILRAMGFPTIIRKP
jgi:hypothetical protein